MNGALILKPEPCCDMWPLCSCFDEEEADDDIEIEFLESDDEDVIRDSFDAERHYGERI